MVQKGLLTAVLKVMLNHNFIKLSRILENMELTAKQLVDTVIWVYKENVGFWPDEVLNDSLKKYDSNSIEYQAIQNIINYRKQVREEFMRDLR